MALLNIKQKRLFSALAVLTLLIIISAPAYASDWSVRWNFTTEDGVKALAVDDIDGDGFAEVVAATALDNRLGNSGGMEGWLYVLDKDGNQKWMKGTSVFGCKITSMIVEDYEGDGKKEVIVGACSYVHFFDGSGNEKFKINLAKNGYEVTSLRVVDVNNDNTKELIIGGHTSDSGAIYVFNNKKQRIFTTSDTQQELTAMYSGDLNNDGQFEYVAGTTGKWAYYPAFLYGYDSSGKQIWKYQTPGAVKSIAAFDLNNDKTLEILVGGNDFLNVFDTKGGLLQSVNLTGNIVNEISSYDLDKDGQNEIITGSSRLIVFDKNLNKKWSSDIIGAETNAIKFYDIDSDTFAEIIAASQGLHVYGKDGAVKEEGLFPNNVLGDFALYDLTGDDYPEIIAGLLGGKIGRVYALSSQLEAKKTNASRTYKRAVDFLSSGNLTGAEEYAREAQTLFKNLGDTGGVNNAKELLNKIVIAEDQTETVKKAADEYYSKAQAAYVSGDLATAIVSARLAKEKYLQISDTLNSRRCDEIIKNSAEALNNQATESFDKAMSFFENKQYLEAYNFANQSLALYSALKDNSGISKSSTLFEQAASAAGINLSEKNNSTTQSGGLDSGTQNTLLIGLGGIIALVLVGFAALKLLKKGGRREGKRPNLKIEDETKIDSIIDDVEKDESKKNRHRDKIREIKKDDREEEKHRDILEIIDGKKKPWIGLQQKREKVEEPKQDITETVSEPKKKHEHATHVHAPEIAPEHKHSRRKNMHLEKITKDGFRGLGVSLSNLGVKKTEEAKKVEEEDLSD